MSDVFIDNNKATNNVIFACLAFSLPYVIRLYVHICTFLIPADIFNFEQLSRGFLFREEYVVHLDSCVGSKHLQIKGFKTS